MVLNGRRGFCDCCNCRCGFVVEMVVIADFVTLVVVTILSVVVLS